MLGMLAFIWLVPDAGPQEPVEPYSQALLLPTAPAAGPGLATAEEAPAVMSVDANQRAGASAAAAQEAQGQAAPGGTEDAPGKVWAGLEHCPWHENSPHLADICANAIPDLPQRAASSAQTLRDVGVAC